MVTTRPPKTIVKPTALGPGANTDTKLLIYGLFQKGRVLAQDGVPWRSGREVIRAVVPHGTAENRERFEAVMLCYVSLYERTRDGYIGDVLTRIGLRFGGELLAAYELQT